MLQKLYGMPLLQLCFKHSECSKSASYKTKNTIWFLMLGNDFLYSTIILLTPSATRIIMLGSPNDSPSFGHKRKFTIHISLFTRHYSRVLFTITVHSIITGIIHYYCSLNYFAYLRGVVPCIQASVCLSVSSELLP